MDNNTNSNNVSNIAEILCLPQKLLATWNLGWVSWQFSLLKLYLDFELLFLPKISKILIVRHVIHPQHIFTKFYRWQVFNRITEFECISIIPWWMIGVSDFFVEIHFFSYKHQVNWVQLQLCLIWNIIFPQSTQPTLVILCLKFYLKQACSFGI